MNTRTGVFLTLCLLTIGSGCSTMNNTEKGALIGGGVGTVAGTIIGAATGNPRTGAAIGALGGATIGGLAGNADDKREQAIERASHQQQLSEARQQQAVPLGMIDVVKMVREGVNEDVIINQIYSTGSTFQLSTNDLEYLTQCQVPPRVIQAMQTNRRRVSSPPPPQTVVIREQSPVVIERPMPYYYGPPAMGFSYVRVR